MAELKLQADAGGGASSLKGPASSGTTPSWRLPSADGTSGQALTTDGSGVMSWGTVAGGKVLQWSVFTNNTRTELTKTTSGNTNRVTLWSVSVNKTVASSTLAWFGHVPTHDDHSAGLQMVTDYGGTEIPGGWSFTYTPTGWTGTINLSGYISGHTTTGAQTLAFKYYSQNQGADNAPAVYINPSSTDENRHNQTQSMLTVLELGA
jgi:hypothetical protein